MGPSSSGDPVRSQPCPELCLVPSPDCVPSVAMSLGHPSLSLAGAGVLSPWDCGLSERELLEAAGPAAGPEPLQAPA